MEVVGVEGMEVLVISCDAVEFFGVSVDVEVISDTFLIEEISSANEFFFINIPLGETLNRKRQIKIFLCTILSDSIRESGSAISYFL